MQLIIYIISLTLFTMSFRLFVCMFVCPHLKAPKRNALAIYKIFQNIITPRLDQRDYFQLAILFKRRYMDILNFQLLRRGYLIIAWPFVHVTLAKYAILNYVTPANYAILRHAG